MKPVRATAMGGALAITSQFSQLGFSETRGRQGPGIAGGRASLYILDPITWQLPHHVAVSVSTLKS